MAPEQQGLFDLPDEDDSIDAPVDASDDAPDEESDGESDGVSGDPVSDGPEPARQDPPAAVDAEQRVVRVLPDVAGLPRAFDYAVPDAMADDVRVGTLVRIALQGRRVGAWVIEDHVTPPAGVTVRPLAKVTGWGPPPDLVELSSWAAWRWAGRRSALLGTASPAGAVPGLPRPPSLPGGRAPVTVTATTPGTALAEAALDAGGASVLRLPPAEDRFGVVLAAARRGPSLVVAPSLATAAELGGRLRRAGVPAAVVPRGWAAARAGGVTVVGARAAAWAPCEALAAVVVLDEHDEVHQEERAPTWHARDVAVERARRAGVPALLVSPCPSLEALGLGPLRTVARVDERAGWPAVDVIDRRDDDPLKGGPLSARLVDLLRSDRRVVCVLNRRGRSRLLACAACGELAGCERCGSAVAQDDAGVLVCHRCGAQRPTVCLVCTTTRFKNLRAGVTRVAEELAALANRSVVEVSGDAPPAADLDPRAVLVGTEAVLHHVRAADAVVFLDLDQELLAPRYRAAEQALGLVVRAARLLGGRAGGGRLVLQTRQPEHEVVQAALLADPARVADAERERRRALRFPPEVALAEVSGPSAPAFIEALGAPGGVEVLGPADGRWLLRAPDHVTLCDALAGTERPGGRLRVAVDPLRI